MCCKAMTAECMACMMEDDMDVDVEGFLDSLEVPEELYDYGSSSDYPHGVHVRRRIRRIIRRVPRRRRVIIRRRRIIRRRPRRRVRRIIRRRRFR